MNTTTTHLNVLSVLTETDPANNTVDTTYVYYLLLRIHTWNLEEDVWSFRRFARIRWKHKTPVHGVHEGGALACYVARLCTLPKSICITAVLYCVIADSGYPHECVIIVSFMLM